MGERVIYFFAIDADKKLVGVLPTRRLLTAPLEKRLDEIMVRRVVAIPASATVLEACEFFVLYKFFAFPVVDEQRHVVGVVDVSLFAEEMLEAGEREEEKHQPTPSEDIFEALGVRLAQIRGASPWRVFRYRFRGCSRPLLPGLRAHVSPARLNLRSPTAWWSHSSHDGARFE